MKKLILSILTLLTLTGCTTTNKNITYTKAKELITEKQAIIIDVRTIEEYNEQHIENAYNIPLDNIENINNYINNKEQYIIVYCRSGNRSKQAQTKLTQLGYTNVYNLGAMSNWEE